MFLGETLFNSIHEDDISQMEGTPPHSLPKSSEHIPTSTYLLLVCAFLEAFLHFSPLYQADPLSLEVCPTLQRFSPWSS